MKCQECGKDLEIGHHLTPRGNEVEWVECPCGFFEIE